MKITVYNGTYRQSLHPAKAGTINKGKQRVLRTIFQSPAPQPNEDEYQEDQHRSTGRVDITCVAVIIQLHNSSMLEIKLIPYVAIKSYQDVRPSGPLVFDRDETRVWIIELTSPNPYGVRLRSCYLWIFVEICLIILDISCPSYLL